MCAWTTYLLIYATSCPGTISFVLARLENQEIIRTQTKLVPRQPVAYIRETSTTPPPNIYWHNGQFLNIQFFMWCWSISISIVKVILEIFWQCILFSLLFRPWRLIQLIIIRQMSQTKNNVNNMDCVHIIFLKSYCY